MTADDPREQRARDWMNGPDDEVLNVEDTADIIIDLLAVVDELRQWKAEAAEVMLGLQDLGKVLGVPYGTRITGKSSVEAAEALWDRLDAAEYERDQLLVRAGVERARAERAEAKLDDHHRTRTNQPWEER